MPETRFTVRATRLDDTDDLLVLIDALADYEHLARPDAEARKRLIADGFHRTPPRFWVYLAVEDNGKAAGYAIVLETYSSFLARPTLYIEDLFVHPDARQGGAGSALFHFLAEEAVRRDCGRMEWVCLDWNQLAISFYEKRGAEHLTDWRYYRLTNSQLRELTEKTG